MAISTKTKEYVALTYAKYFGRTADADTISNYVSIGKTSKILKQIIEDADIEQYNVHGNDLQAEVHNEFQNLFSRNATNKELEKYVKVLQKGKNLPINSIVKKASKFDNDVYKNKQEIAKFVAENGGAVVDLSKVTKANLIDVKSLASLTDLQSKIDALPENSNVPSAFDGKAFMLTEGVDSGKDFVGTAKDDLFSSNTKIVIDPATGTKTVIDTIDSQDILDGGKGKDTLNIVTAVATTNATPTLTNIENVNVKFQAGSTIDLVNATGVETVKVHNSTGAAGTVASVAGATLSVANQKVGVDFDGSTAEKLNLNFDTVGIAATTTPLAAATLITVDLAAGATANKATSFNITAKDAYVNLTENTSFATTSATIAATGINEIIFTDDATTLTSVSVTGKGSVDLSGAELSALKTLTAADGGVTVNANGTVLETVTTGAGADTITVLTAGLSATATINLGAGDDLLTLAATPAAGATLTAGDGTDTLGMAKASYTTVAAYSTTNLAKITGFEVLSITDILTAGSYDVSKIAGITSFKAAAGITNGATAIVSNLGVNSTVELAGADTAIGNLTANLKTDTTADTMTLKLNREYTDGGDNAADPVTASYTVLAATVETLNVVSTGNMLPITPVDGYKADVLTNTLTLTNSNELTSLVVSGDKALSFTSDNGMTKLATIDASANTAGVEIDASAALATSVALTIKGTAKADTITGGALGDTITLGTGNDTVDYSTVGTISKIGTGKFDTITDFIANTAGNLTTASTAANADSTKWNGDVLKFDAFGAGATAGAKVDVLASAADATTFLANNKSATNGITAALDSTNSNLYVDNTGDGLADFYIHLAGVKTIDAAAFLVI